MAKTASLLGLGKRKKRKKKVRFFFFVVVIVAAQEKKNEKLQNFKTSFLTSSLAPTPTPRRGHARSWGPTGRASPGRRRAPGPAAGASLARLASSEGRPVFFKS